MMKVRRFSIIAAATVFLLAPTVSAEAAPLSDAQIHTIKANCVAAQSSIQQLHRTEVATRNNRGRAYESISKIMVALNSRIVQNKLSAPQLTTSTEEMEQRFNAFKNDYSTYYDSVDSLIRLKCADQPVTFYDMLTRSRELRATVATDIRGINETLDTYQKGVNELRASVESGDSQ